MAIYHLSVSTRARGFGASHAAYIERTGKYAGKEDLEASESGNMPGWAVDKSSRFWAAADSFERANGRAYTEIELSLPRELSAEQRVELVREFVEQTLGDRHAYTWAIHNPKASDGLDQPHAHVMFSERVMDGIDRDPEQFFKRFNAKEPELGGAGKDRAMNARVFVNQVREQWAMTANRYLEREGVSARIDHRSYREMAREIGKESAVAEQSRIAELEPQMKRGASVHVQARGVMSDLAGEVREQMARNGERLIAEPGIALAALTAHQSVFTKRDVERFVMGHSDGAEQFAAAYLKVMGSEELVALSSPQKWGDPAQKDRNWGGVERFTTKSVLEIEDRLLDRVDRLVGDRAVRSVPDSGVEAGRTGRTFNPDQDRAYQQLVGDDRIATVHGAAGTGKSYVLAGMREAFESSGFVVYGAILQGKTAEDLERDSGIKSQTMHGFLNAVEKGYLTLGNRSVVVVDEAGMVGSRQMERLLGYIEASGARLRLVGDTKQLHAVDYGDAFGQLAQRTPVAGLSKIARQRVGWQREASEAFSRHEIGAGLAAYEAQGAVRGFDDELAAREALLAQWSSDRVANPDQTQIILAHTNGLRESLNSMVRATRKERGELGAETLIKAEKGSLKVAVGERLMFGKNDYGDLLVKNGTLGTVQSMAGSQLEVELDSGRSVSVDTREYRHLDYGYALTVHKSQGMTVDRAYVMASPSMSAQSTYVGMTRHREAATLFYGRDAFAERGGLAVSLSRAEKKEFSGEYEVVPDAIVVPAGIDQAGINKTAAPQTLAERVKARDQNQGASAKRSRLAGGLQRALPGVETNPGADRFAEPALDAVADRERRERNRAAASPEKQVAVYDMVHAKLADGRANRIRGVADKTAARQQRREKTLASVRAGRPEEPRGLLAAFKRNAYEKQLEQWQGRMDSARSLADEAQALHQAVGRAKQGRVVDAHARGRLERLDPGFVKRVDGFKQEALDRAMAERERVWEQERAKERDRGKDRGLER